MKGKKAVLAVGFAAVLLGAFVAAHLFAEGDEAEFIGSKKCRKCHFKVYRDWAKRGHAKAFEPLKPEDMDKVCDKTKKKCVACHVTGYGKPGGFSDPEKDKHLAEVGCEACHGPGSLHADMSPRDLREIKKKGGDLKIKMADPEACVYCHNPHINFKELYGE